MSAKLRRAFYLVLTTLREIFDERAYDRYLVRTGFEQGRESYGMFIAEREAMAATKPRCC